MIASVKEDINHALGDSKQAQKFIDKHHTASGREISDFLMAVLEDTLGEEADISQDSRRFDLSKCSTISPTIRR